MKMTMSTTATMSARVHRKVIRAPHKRAHPGKSGLAGKMLHAGKMANPGKFSHMGKFGKLAHYAHTHALRPPEPCDNSNDSGLGPDPVNRLSESLEEWEHAQSKRQQDENVKIECDNANDAYSFQTVSVPVLAPAFAPAPPNDILALPIPAIRAGCSLSSPNITETPGKRFQDPAYRSCGKLGSGKLASKYAGGGKLAGPGGKLSGKLGGKLSGKYGGKLAQALARRRALAAMHSGTPGLSAPLTSRSRDGTVELQILCQPETQHRARYQTEGSRGAVKDNSGNGFPIVKLVGYDKPAVLQVFIGTDTGRVAPHMFYQACRVSGKNSTPCKERKEDGTVVIEIDLEPTKNWQVTCDCVGILKERNVDVEHRFGETLGAGGGGGAHASRGKKKSTRCRMVFRTDIVDANGQVETLQVCSTQIICTQPPGVPEVCRKSLVSCPATGGLELYLLGKNFLKETRVVFRAMQEGRTWEEEVVPDKEFLQQTHLVCCVPPYQRADIAESVGVQLFVRSGGKASEPHPFYYTPPALDRGPPHCTRHHSQPVAGEEARPMLYWGGMMPPPALPVPGRRPSLLMPDPHSPLGLKSEMTDDSSQHSLVEHADGSCGAEGPEKPGLEDLKVIDLRLKSETITREQSQVGFVNAYDQIKLSPTQAPSESSSPDVTSFTQTLQAIQHKVHTDKVVESVTAAIFNSDDPGGQIYADPQMMPMDPMRRLISADTQMGPMQTQMGLEGEMKALAPEMMLTDGALAGAGDRRLLAYDPMPPPAPEGFDPFGAIGKLEATQMERRLAHSSAQMEALVEDAMKATAAMLPGDAAKLDELVNSRVDDHLAGAAPPPADALPPPAGILDPQGSLGLPQQQDDLLMMADIPTSVKTPPAAVKSMILNAAAEILTSDTTMNALVTSAINTANILTDGSGVMQDAQPPAEPAAETPLVAMSQAVSQAVTQAVSQAVSHAVSQAVSQEMTRTQEGPVQGLTDMSDQDLLSYINTSAFDQV